MGDAEKSGRFASSEQKRLRTPVREELFGC